MYKKKSGNVWKGSAESGSSIFSIGFKKLKFKGSSVEGKGKDHSGKYKVFGSLSHNNVEFIKTYKKSSVSVTYNGTFNPQGQIVGRY